MQQLLSTLLAEFRTVLSSTEDSVHRAVKLPSVPSKVRVAIGMRRVGKTYLMFQTIRQLVQDDTPINRILYVNFEDDRLYPFTQKKLAALIEAFYEMYPENHDAHCYLFFDEIQNVDEWPLVIRRFLDSKSVDIFLTGSSSKLLSKEIATSLRGRAMSAEVWPFSFQEYLIARGVSVDTELFSKKTQDILLQQLKSYLFEGGFPESVGLTTAERRQLLQDYVEVVIMRDIVERHGVSNISLLRYMILFMLKNSGGGLSINKFANDIKSQGLSGSKNTIYDYLSYLEESYLVFAVPLFSESLRKTQTNPRKIYAIDPGLVKALTLSMNENYGHLFENLVFLDLKRKGHKVHYYLTRQRYEVDFLTEDPLGKMKLFQVVWDQSDENTMEREQRALDAAMRELGADGEIVTRESYLQGSWRDYLRGRLFKD